MGSKLKNSGLVAVGIVAGVAISMQFSALAQKPVDGGMPMDSLHELANVYGLIKSDYVEPVNDKKLLTDAISGMVGALDPHSAYLDQKAYRELREGTEGKFVGLGIEISQSEDGYVRIVSPIEDSPAWRAGIKQGDLIVAVDGVSLKGMDMDDAIKRMRGEPKTKVGLTVRRLGEQKPLAFTIVREEIVQKSVKARLVEPGYAWIRVSQFQEPTVDDLADKLAALYKQDANLKGVILDLRNDPGGLLQGAIGVAAAFLPKGAEVVSTNGQLADSKQHFYGKAEYYMLHGGEDPLAKVPAVFRTLPMAVLVNTGTASARCRTTSARPSSAAAHSARARCRRSARSATTWRSS
jgi:carboxyl-terminal processing protease